MDLRVYWVTTLSYMILILGVVICPYASPINVPEEQGLERLRWYFRRFPRLAPALPFKLAICGEELEHAIGKLLRSTFLLSREDNSRLRGPRLGSPQFLLKGFA